MSVNYNPYINFNGHAREAMTFYAEALGGEVSIMTFGDYHMQDLPADGVMHAQITVNGKIILMGSDGMDSDGTYTGFKVSLSGGQDDADTLRDYFDKLSAGGEVTMPLKKEMWGDELGILKDKFGIEWMVDIAGAPIAE